MRMILCQWLIETYHRSVAYLDFILSYETNIDPNELQYVGAAALFFAAKLEELEEQSIDLFIQFALCEDEDEDEDDASKFTALTGFVYEDKKKDAIDLLLKYERKIMKIPGCE
ncbi:hypothetical protein HDU96_003021 [Phlyctochytrium bullatum]|nr:hypothetical protein HDU96_003021 [Phlyctochytrium bullatum]